MRFHFLTLIAFFTSGISAAVHAFTNDPNTVPFWWTYTGTPILDGLVFYAIVPQDTPPALPGLTRLYETESWRNGDYFYTSSYSEFQFVTNPGPGSPEYELGAFNKLYIFGDQEPNTVPLYRFFNGQNHFYTTDYDEGTSNAYNLEGVVGYVYLSANNGAVPIYRWHEDDYSFPGGD